MKMSNKRCRLNPRGKSRARTIDHKGLHLFWTRYTWDAIKRKHDFIVNTSIENSGCVVETSQSEDIVEPPRRN